NVARVAALVLVAIMRRPAPIFGKQGAHLGLRMLLILLPHALATGSFSHCSIPSKIGPRVRMHARVRTTRTLVKIWRKLRRLGGNVCRWELLRRLRTQDRSRCSTPHQALTL